METTTDNGQQTTDAAKRLSIAACELLDYLRRFAPSPDRAKTDAQISAATNIPKRDIIELADELATHGHAVVANCTESDKDECEQVKGRWLLLPNAPPEHYKLANRYDRTLESRFKKIAGRRSRFESALRVTEAQRPAPVPSGQQGNLFAMAPSNQSRDREGAGVQSEPRP